MDIGKVPSDSGIFRSTTELREFVLGLMGHTGKERKASRVAAPLPHGLVLIGLGKGGAPSFLLLLPSLFPIPCGRWNPTRTGES